MRRVTAALLLGAVSATGFAPLHLWPLTLLCLAGLFHLVARARGPLRAAGIGYAFGLGQFTVGLNWIAHAFTFQDAMPHWLGYLAVVLLSVYLAVYPAAATALAAAIARKRPLALVPALAGCWALAEYLRATLFTGFAWNPLGVLWLDTGVEHSARLIGTYGLGMLALLAAGGLWLVARGQWRPGGLLVALVGGAALAGHLTLPEPAMSGVPITVVQPNINQNAKYDPALEATNYLRLAKLTGSGQAGSPRLIFWPEAAVPAFLDLEPGWRQRLADLMSPRELLLLGGDKLYLNGDQSAYDPARVTGANNSLWVLTPGARLIGRYDKAHLVPYGEYLPMRPILSAIGLSRLVPGSIDFWPGPGPRTLTLPATAGRAPLHMGVQICYEIIFSGQVVDTRHRPDFLFNPSNDAWFGSWGPPQHLAQARLRAVEEAVPVIRSTPTGISAVVDAQGRVQHSLPLDTAGAINASLPAPAPATPFALYGNLLPLLFALILLISAVALGRRTG